jgi:hypothetical protein
MPATTPGRNLPYPVGTDRVTDGDDAIRRLAQSVENMVQSGTASLASSTGGATNTIAITFPTAFTANPQCQATPNTAITSPQTLFWWVQSISGTGFTIAYVPSSAGGRGFHWQAVGPVAAVA